MRSLFLLFSLPFLMLLLTSCEVKQQPIAYGQANCQHCQMTVSDNRFGSELVTKTGKAYFFDSTECLMSYLQEKPEEAKKAELLLVSDFSKPGNLVAAEKAVFLQSKNLPSPMGMFLSAYADEAAATSVKQEKGGRLLSWNEALTAVKNHEKPE